MSTNNVQIAIYIYRTEKNGKYVIFYKKINKIKILTYFWYYALKSFE